AGATITVSDTQVAVADPLAQTYVRLLTIQQDDPIAGAEDVCSAAEAEFDNEQLIPLVINDVQVITTMAMTPLVTVSIEAAGPSVCPLPLRVRTVRTDDAFAIELYHSTAEGDAACTRDLQPFTQGVSLGTLASPDFTLTVNGEAVE
ncbi:MAG: hypothetical protein JW910_13740, partial [Anaerolineae bacterium]|nr:hypothetical protein [Anaerolineae bacterium]